MTVVRRGGVIPPAGADWRISPGGYERGEVWLVRDVDGGTADVAAIRYGDESVAERAGELIARALQTQTGLRVGLCRFERLRRD